MKPPVLSSRPPVSPVPPERPRDTIAGNCISGAVSLVLCLFVGFTENPLVPLTHVFGIVPITLGIGVGLALIRRRFPRVGNAPYWAAVVGMAFYVIANRTSLVPVFLLGATFSLTRAILLYQDSLE